MASVFLSYDRDDADKARPLAQALEKAGHEVWWDLHLRGGAQFSKVIEEALRASDAVVVLWSVNSVESAWVRDEASEGLKRGKLVPLSVGNVSPPMGFRQFQTIDLGAWKGRGKVPRLSELLEAIESQSTRPAPQVAMHPTPQSTRPTRIPTWLIGAAAAAALLVLAAAAWSWLGRGSLPNVEVAAADASPRSRAAANDLFVKLGSLAQIGKGKWQLVDAASASRRPDLVFRAADTGSAGQPDTNVVLLDGKDNSVLWSREFSASGAAPADLRQRMSLTTGRVLGCALEARANGGLRRDLFKIFLDGCAQLAEESSENPEKAAAAMRTVVTGQPRFAPARARLLFAQMGVFTMAHGTDDQPAAERQRRQDIQEATKVAPDLPEITLAQVYLLPPTAYAQSLALFAKAKARAPDTPQIYSEEATALARVGRMSDSIASARRAAELDPLSPAMETQLVMTLAYGGEVAEARRELDREQKLWAGTAALADAQYAFNLRFGDLKIAQQFRPVPAGDVYARARADPSPQNVEALASLFRPFEARANPDFAGLAIQDLGEFHRTDDVFRWLAKVPTPGLAEAAYVLFRPALTDVQRDRRFMLVAKRIGLIDYWRQSGKWPDYCRDPDVKYDCKAEAAKLA